MKYLLSLFVPAVLGLGQNTSLLNTSAGTAGVIWTFIQQGYYAGCVNGSTGPACTVSTSTGTGTYTKGIATTTAGDLVIAVFTAYAVESSAANPLTSGAITGDSFTHCPSIYPYNYQIDSASGVAIDCYYVASSGADTSITYTPTWNAADSQPYGNLYILEYKRSLSTATYDTGNVTTNTTCGTSCSGPSLSGFSGSTPEVCLQIVAASNTASSISGSYSSPFNDVDNAFVFGAIAGNVSVSSYSAPIWTLVNTGDTPADFTMAASCWK